MGFNSFDFTNDVCTNLMGNISTLSTSNATLNMWTDATGDLNQAYLVGNKSNPMWVQIYNEAASIGKSTATPPTTGQQDMVTFINKYMASNDYVDDFSMSIISLLLNRLSDPSVWDPTAGPTQMSTIQTFGNLVSAQQQKETATGDTQSKAQASFIQQANSAQQPVSDLGTAAIGILGSTASLLMQSFL